MSATLHQESLYHAITAIDEAYLEEAFPRIRPKISRRLERLGAMAALLAAFISILFIPVNPTKLLLVSGPFVLTAETTNGYLGDYSELKNEMWNNLFSAYTPGYQPKPRFGDHDLFQISIVPEGWAKKQCISFYYNLCVYYEDTVVDTSARDSHIDWGFCTPTSTASSDSTSYFHLTGWFDEPTDLRIEIQKKDGTVIQEQTVHIEYNSILRSYELTVIEYKLYAEGE